MQLVDQIFQTSRSTLAGVRDSAEWDDRLGSPAQPSSREVTRTGGAEVLGQGGCEAPKPEVFCLPREGADTVDFTKDSESLDQDQEFQENRNYTYNVLFKELFY